MQIPDSTDSHDDVITLTRDLIRINTTNYGDGKSLGEHEAAEYVEAYLRDCGLEPRLYEAAPKRTSVVTRVHGRNAAKPALVVHGHLDVVPADPRRWSVDPFKGVIAEGMLWGRGAVDMKNMDAMILTAVKDVLEAGGPERELIIAFFADEENGGAFGSQFLVREYPELFDGATEAISEVGGYSIDVGPDGQRAYLVQTAEKTLMWLRLKARGTAVHGSQMIDDNAVTAIAEAVAKIGNHHWPLRLTSTTRELTEALATILNVDAHMSPDDLVRQTSASGFLRGTFRTTTNPTVLNGGYKHNVIPDTAEAVVDVRTLPGEEDAVLAEIRELVGPEIEVEVTHHGQGLEYPFSGSLIDAVRSSLARHDPEAVILPYMLSGGTDNKSLATLGIRGYGFAPLKLPADLDFPAMFHGVDERVPLESLVFGRRVLADFLHSY